MVETEIDIAGRGIGIGRCRTPLIVAEMPGNHNQSLDLDERKSHISHSQEESGCLVSLIHDVICCWCLLLLWQWLDVYINDPHNLAS